MKIIDSTNVAYYFYSALNSIELNYNEAVDDFQIALSDNSVFDESIQWYLSLCYIKMKNYAEARKLLVVLSEYSRYYGEKASVLLSKIEEIEE